MSTNAQNKPTTALKMPDVKTNQAHLIACATSAILETDMSVKVTSQCTWRHKSDVRFFCEYRSTNDVKKDGKQYNSNTRNKNSNTSQQNGQLGAFRDDFVYDKSLYLLNKYKEVSKHETLL